MLSTDLTNEDNSSKDPLKNDPRNYTPTIPLSEAISYLRELLNAKEEKIEKQSREIGRLEFQIETLVIEIDRLRKQSKGTDNGQEKLTDLPSGE